MAIDRYGRKVTTLRVSITKACNLNCIYCHLEGASTGRGSEITLPQFKVAVEAARRIGID
ncbi:MAG: GTP 3',8-cyclase MoaA, partial [Candidatus Nezhaarchaeota archaeon]|nr:GTP 3',8-cyclase MoaA [Candidatus Nezhaarchaeota archaeon]